MKSSQQRECALVILVYYYMWATVDILYSKYAHYSLYITYGKP